MSSTRDAAQDRLVAHYFCVIVHFLRVALDDDTDELLELMAKNDVLLTPTKQHHHTPGVLMYNEAMGSPHFGQVQLSCTHSSSDSDSDSDKTTHFSDEAEAYTNLKIKGNFTPAPVSHPRQHHMCEPALPNVPNALKELVELMQG